MTNPYTTPTSEVVNKHNPQQNERSAIPKVIGIISLVMAGLGILGSVSTVAMSVFMPQILDAQMNMGFSKSYILGSNGVAFLTSLWAIFIGIKLIKYQDIGRRHYTYYTILSLLISIFAFFYTKDKMQGVFSEMSPEMAKAAQEMSGLSTFAVFLGPIILFIVVYLLNKQRVKDSLS
jgi:hypothetical protein